MSKDQLDQQYKEIIRKHLDQLREKLVEALSEIASAEQTSAGRNDDQGRKSGKSKSKKEEEIENIGYPLLLFALMTHRSTMERYDK